MKSMSDYLHHQAWMNNAPAKKLRLASIPQGHDPRLLQNVERELQWPAGAVPVNRITDALYAVALAHGQQAELVAKR
jgi:hypothetical protein